MPKNPLKNFTRRKSSGNVLDLQSEQSSQPAVSSFKVLERPNGGIDRRTSSQRPLSAMPFGQSKGKSTEDLRHLGTSANNRGSGTTTLSGSSGYYDTSSSSARYSSSSTLPSSFDQENDPAHDELFPPKGVKQVYQNNVLAQAQASAGAPKEPWNARASRAMSFGLRKKQDSPPTTMQSAVIDTIPALPDNAAIRDRATTISSYASTAVPPRLEANLGSADFSSDFGNMFEGLAESKKELPLPPPPRAHGGYLRSMQDSEPLFPASSYSRPMATPSPDPELQLQQRPPNLTAANKRYSWQSRTSNDGLMSPGLDSDMASPQETITAPSGFARFRPGYQPVPLRYASPGFEGDSQPGTPNFPPTQPLVNSSSDDEVSQEENSPPLSRTEPKVLATALQLPSRSRASPPVPAAAQHPAMAIVREHRASDSAAYASESQSTTPRAKNLQPRVKDESMFDISPAGGAASLAVPHARQARAGAQSQSPQKRMTRAQFEMQQAARGHVQSDHSDNDSEDGYDDGDEDERQAELIRQRRKQEANLAVYRQQMMKASGGQPAELPSRPGMGDRATMSAPLLQQGLDLGGGIGEDEDDDVPLGILQAHGFPNKNRPPTRLGGGSAPPTPGSQTGSVMGDPAGGVLPPFARRLPQMPPDPYFGASLVNPSYRESLAFGANGPGSAYGGPAPAVQPVYPSGLVGVIAGEEKARALRRGSPNATNGGYGPIPLPSNMMQMPQMMPRSNSNMSMGMGGMMPPMPPMGMPGMMNPMGMDQQTQMMQMMQMQQQMMQSIMQMQSGQPSNMNFQPSPSMQSLGNGFLNPNAAQRPMSSSVPGSPNVDVNNAGRSMTMMQPPPQWGDNGAAHGRSNTMGSNSRPMGYAGSVYNFNLSAPTPTPGYTPSIAPSERSNVGMPSRYRPVSTMEANGANSRSQTMGSNMDAVRQSAVGPSHLGGASSAPKSTIRVIDKPKGTPKSPTPRHSADDEDDDEGWAQLRAKREARKTKRMTTSQRTEPALSELYANVE